MSTVSSMTYLTDPAPRVTCTPPPGDLTSQMMYLGSDVTDSRMSNLSSPCTWGYTSTLLRVTPPPRPNTWVQMPSLQGDPTSNTLTLVTHPVSRVNPPPRPCTWNYISSFQSEPTSWTLTWDHMSTISMMKASQPCTWVTCPQALRWHPPRPWTGVTCLQSEA